MKRLFCILSLVSLLMLVDISAAQGDSLPDEAYISGVSGHAQSFSLSCEARSATDWAAYWGVSIGETEFLEALPDADNPDEGFVGNPNEAWGNLPPHGYGVHAGPVAETLRDFGLEAEAYNNLEWDDLRQEINAGRPVIVWVIGQMWGGTPVEYEDPDGSTSRVAAFEHTMVLTGYSLDGVQVVDAYSGQYQTYWLNTFLNSWSVLGNMAVFGSREATSHDDPAPETYGESYSVQQGDYLVALAKRFSTTWQELAELNSIGYPYTIYPGQVLQLPWEEAQAAQPEPAPEPVSEPETVSEPVPAAPPPPGIQVINFRLSLPIVHRNSTTPPTQSTEFTPTVHAPIETEIALHSDTLLSFVHSIGENWRLLVKMNDLPASYIVRPGLVLRLR
jgi:uncharacterized protein YvpB/LysM repeat protein